MFKEKLTSKVAKEASKDLNISTISCLILQTLSEVQILYITLAPFFLPGSDKFDKLFLNIDQNSPNVNFSVIWGQPDSFKVIIANVFCYLYILYQFSLLIFVTIKIKHRNAIKPWISKHLTLSCILHNKIFFFVVHCVLVQTISFHNGCQSSKESICSYYSTFWFVASMVFAVLNIMLALIKELCFYQIRKCKNSLAIKDNVYSLIQLSQKAVNIILWLFLKSSSIPLAIMNVILNLFNLYFIHTRLSFYNLTLLRIGILFTTISAVVSLASILVAINYDNDVKIPLILLVPLALKLSLNKLNHSLKRILHLHLDTPYKAAHLPGLVNKYLKDISSFMTKKKVSSNAFYIYGFLKDDMFDILKLQGYQGVHESKIRAYSIVTESLLKILKRYPNNEILLLTISQIYIKHLGNVSRAVCALSCLNRHKSIIVRNSAQDLYGQLEELFQKRNMKLDKDHNHINYFWYKQKASALKKEIQIELLSHFKFWEALNKKAIIDSGLLLGYAENIKKQADKIEMIWQKELEGLSKQYANISLLYGRYIDIVQGKSFIGEELIKRSFEMMINVRDHSRTEINEILDGNSAIVIASVEPEKLGKVTDASASVKQLFDIDKNSLIGAHINKILPQFIAKRHNDLLSKYYKNFKNSYDQNFISYAKTLNNKYFQVEINLKFHPNIQQGINLMAYIVMKSKHLSLMIVDDDGKVLECSKDLKSTFNLTERADFSRICKEFFQINQAFNIIYRPRLPFCDLKNEKEGETSEQIDQLMKRSRKNPDSIYVKKSTFSPRSEPLTTGRDWRETQRQLLVDEIADTEDYEMTLRKQSILVNIQKGEAESICNRFKEGSRLKFFFGESGPLGKIQESEFEVQIQPYLFDGDLYKIWKLKPVTDSSKIGVLSQQKMSLTQCDKFAEQFPNAEKIRDLSVSRQNEDSKEPNPVSPNIFSEIGANTLMPLQVPGIYYQGESSEIIKIKKEQVYPASPKTQTFSVKSVYQKNKTIINNLTGVFNKKKISSRMKISLIIIYLTFIGVIALAVLDSIVKLNSLDEMQKAVGLIDIVNKRLLRTIYAWQSVLVVYSRSAGLRPVTNTAKAFQVSAKTASLDMVQNNNLLKAQVVNFGNSEIAEIFFAKTISLWDPFTNKTSLSGKVDSFTANERLHSCNLLVADYPGSVIDLKNKEEVLFTINNTANDYLITVETAINKVERFYSDSAENNMSYLVVLLSSKILALLIPSILMVILCRVLLRSYSKLFRAISKIENSKIIERISQLKEFRTMLDKDVEENTHLFVNRKMVKPKLVRTLDTTTNFSVQNKEFSLKSLFLYIGKYFLLLFIIAVPLVLLFVITFSQAQNSFSSLNSVIRKMLISYRLGSQTALILPNFYFLTIFKNQTSFKIRNGQPDQQLLYHINFLDTANDILISEIQSAKDEPLDFFVESLLQKNLCDYMTGTDYTSCLDSTSHRSFGLLGLNSKYLVTCVEMMKDFLIIPTFAKGSQLLATLSPLLGSIPPVMKKGYELLAGHFLDNFLKKAQDQETKTLTYLFANTIAILFWKILILVTIIRKMKKLELGIRKILRIIPFSLICGSKAMQYYLSDEFKKELKDIKEF